MTAKARAERKEELKCLFWGAIIILIVTCVIGSVIVSRLGEPKDTLPNTGIICSEEVSI